MSAGTLALTNGSTTVTGSSTAFQTDLAVNDFIVCKIGGTTYTLGVSTIGSNTALTLTQPFSGPTTTGVAWYAVPNQTLVGITTELAANLTTVYRSVLINDANWTKVFSQSGNITVTLKDGSTFTGPSWNSIATTLSNKANTAEVLTKADNLASIADKAVARSNLGWVGGSLPVLLGGTGGATPQAARTGLGLLSASTYDVVGTVANNGAIIEQGSNANGRYTKYADGTMICEGFGPLNNVSSTARTEGAVTGAFADFTWTFPAQFVATPSVVGSGTVFSGSGASGTTRVFSTVQSFTPSTTSAILRIWSLNDFASISNFSKIAIGRWKA